MKFKHLITLAAVSLLMIGAPVNAHAMVHAGGVHTGGVHTSGVHTGGFHSSSVHSHSTEIHSIHHVSKTHSHKINSVRRGTKSYHVKANRQFARVKMRKATQRAYHRQSVITNPWLWAFMYQHHRLSSEYRNSKQYLAGYKAGYQASQKDLKNHSRLHQNLTEQQERQHDKTWQHGYFAGYEDGITHKNNK